MSTLRINANVALRDFPLVVELAVAGGERLALVGPSGAGKTTVMRVIAGLLRPATGRITMGERTWLDTAAGADIAPEERRCGYLFQDYALFPRMPAWRNVAYGMRGLARAERRSRALDLLDGFGVAGLSEALPTSLSGGERQRVALARALGSDPEVLLLDEPLSALDPQTRSGSLRELDELLSGLGIPVILVTHSFDEAALLSDRLVVLDRGTVVQRGTAAEVSARPVSAFVADFSGAVVLRGIASSGVNGLTEIALDGGGTVRSTDAAAGPVALSVFPWEISLQPPGADSVDSALNRLGGEVRSVTAVGNRARVALSVPQPLTAEVTLRSVEALGLRPGERVTAAWKATATRIAGGATG
jgi:molybdate transport system ATP-binding protein